MNIELNTKDKEIRITQDVNLQEVFAELCIMLGDDFSNYTLKVDKVEPLVSDSNTFRTTPIHPYVPDYYRTTPINPYVLYCGTGENPCNNQPVTTETNNQNVVYGKGQN